MDGLPVKGRRILIYSMAGNRRDEDFASAALEATRHFDFFIVYAPAQSYWRTRSADEICHLLREGFKAAGVSDERVRVVGNSADALCWALGWAEPGDLLFVATFDTERAWHQITRHAEEWQSAPPR